MLFCCSINIYIYIYAFGRRFYPKRLTVHSGYTFFFFFFSTCVSWESNPQPLRCQHNALTTEPQEHTFIIINDEKKSAIFGNNVKVFTATFDQFNVSLLNKSMNFFKIYY